MENYSAYLGYAVGAGCVHCYTPAQVQAAYHAAAAAGWLVQGTTAGSGYTVVWVCRR